MAIKIRGIDPRNQLIRQPGGTLRMLEDGTWDATERFVAGWGQIRSFLPSKNRTQHPDFAPLLATDCNISRMEADFAMMTVRYHGIFDTPEPDDEMVISSSREPIETHDKFATEISGFTGASGTSSTGARFVDDKGGLRFDGWTPDSEYAGQESYLAPSPIFRRTSYDANRPSSLDGVGSIDSPGGEGLSLPIGSSSYNWLKTAKSWRRKGGVWVIQEEWQLSGRGGWHPTVYQ